MFESEEELLEGMERVFVMNVTICLKVKLNVENMSL
jgi:hypothetical protein